MKLGAFNRIEYANAEVDRLLQEGATTLDADARRAIAQAKDETLAKIDALFCATDLIALGALDGLRIDRGMKVPQDIQVLGYDDIEQASWGAYDLSTIRQDVYEQTDAVIRMLIDRIHDSALPNRVHNQKLTVVHRSTTKAPN